MRWLALILSLALSQGPSLPGPGTVHSTGGGGVARVHLVGSCTPSAATTLAQTITSTTSGNALAIAEYNEGATSSVSTAMVEVTNTVTVTSTYNPGIGNTVAIRGAIPTGFNGVYAVTASNGTSFTYTNPTSGLGTASTQATNIGLAPTVVASGVTFVPIESDTSYVGGPRTLATWYAKNIPASVTNVTITFPTSTTGCVFVGEYSGVSTTAPLDASCTFATADCSTAWSTTFTSVSVTPTAAHNEAMFGIVVDSSGPDHTANWTASGGWSVAATAYENAGSFASLAYFEQIVASTTGSYTITGGNSGASAGGRVTGPATLTP